MTNTIDREVAIAVLDETFGFGILADGKFTIDSRDIEIDGLLLPKFSWGWIGMSAAQAALDGLGSVIIQGLFSACNRDRSALLSELVARQLEDFKYVLGAQLDELVLKQGLANTQEFLSVFRGYEEEPNELRTKYVLTDFTQTLYGLWQLEFLGYRTYMVLAMLRLAALQERARLAPDQPGRRGNCESFFFEVQQFHSQIVRHIDEQTQPFVHYFHANTSERKIIVEHSNPSGLRQELLVRSAGRDGMNVLGVHLDSGVLLGWPGVDGCTLTRQAVEDYKRAAHNPPSGVYREIQTELVDWFSLKTRIERENTAVGEMMIASMAKYDYQSPPRPPKGVTGVA